MSLRTVPRKWSALFALVCGYFVCFPAPLTAQRASPDIPYPESGIDVGQQAELQKAVDALPLELQDKIVDVIATGSRTVQESLPGVLIAMPPELRKNIVDVILLDPSEDTDVIMDVFVFVYADGSHSVGTMLDSRELEGGPGHHVIETDTISADVLSTHPVSVDLEAGTYTAKAQTQEEVTEALESLTKDSADEGTPPSQGILKPEKRKQESERSFLSFGWLWQSVADFFVPEVQAAGVFYKVTYSYLAYLNDGNIVPLNTHPAFRQVERTHLELRWEISPALRWRSPVTHNCSVSTGGVLGVWLVELCAAGAPVYHPIVPFQSPPPTHVILTSQGRFSNTNLWSMNAQTVIPWQSVSITGRNDATFRCTGTQHVGGENPHLIKSLEGSCFRQIFPK